jgi:hypothetical protein
MEHHTNKSVDRRIQTLAEQPRLHFADWRIAIVEITSELGTLYHPEHGWIAVGMLTTEEQWGLEHAGEPRPVSPSMCPPGSNTRL